MESEHSHRTEWNTWNWSIQRLGSLAGHLPGKSRNASRKTLTIILSLERKYRWPRRPPHAKRFWLNNLSLFSSLNKLWLAKGAAEKQKPSVCRAKRNLFGLTNETRPQGLAIENGQSYKIDWIHWDRTVRAQLERTDDFFVILCSAVTEHVFDFVQIYSWCECSQWLISLSRTIFQQPPEPHLNNCWRQRSLEHLNILSIILLASRHYFQSQQTLSNFKYAHTSLIFFNYFALRIRCWEKEKERARRERTQMELLSRNRRARNSNNRM